jgi:hypothetical protein
MSATIARVLRVLQLLLHPRRLLALIGATLGGLVYLWFASVRSVPGVRRRKAATREAWRRRERRPPSVT